ncbi:hypothetical protein AB9F37_33550, partial [Rhizobium leguminosarum]
IGGFHFFYVIPGGIGGAARMNAGANGVETRERLVDGDDAALAGLSGGAQHRLDLDRMVAVIVEDLHPVPFAGQREATLD